MFEICAVRRGVTTGGLCVALLSERSRVTADKRKQAASVRSCGPVKNRLLLARCMAMFLGSDLRTNGRLYNFSFKS